MEGEGEWAETKRQRGHRERRTEGGTKTASKSWSKRQGGVHARTHKHTRGEFFYLLLYMHVDC